MAERAQHAANRKKHLQIKKTTSSILQRTRCKCSQHNQKKKRAANKIYLFVLWAFAAPAVKLMKMFSWFAGAFSICMCFLKLQRIELSQPPYVTVKMTIIFCEGKKKRKEGRENKSGVWGSKDPGRHSCRERERESVQTKGNGEGVRETLMQLWRHNLISYATKTETWGMKYLFDPTISKTGDEQEIQTDSVSERTPLTVKEISALSMHPFVFIIKMVRAQSWPLCISYVVFAMICILYILWRACLVQLEWLEFDLNGCSDIE